MQRTLSYLLLLVCLTGCESLTPIESVESTIPIAAPIDPPRHIVQHITANWADKQESLLCVLELDKKHIAIAGVSNEGMSLFNLNYDGKTLTLDKSPLLAADFSPEYIIKDLQLVFWSKDELQKLLPPQWHLESDSKYRRLYYLNELRTEVQYLQPDAVWAKSVIVTNHHYHYTLHIDTISYDALPK